MLLAYSFRKVKYYLSQSLSRTIKFLINKILLYLARIEGIHLGKLLNLPVIAGPIWQASWKKETESQTDTSFNFLRFFHCNFSFASIVFALLMAYCIWY